MSLILKYRKIKFSFVDLLILFLLLTSMLRPFLPVGIRRSFFIYKTLAMVFVLFYFILNKKNLKSFLPIFLFSFSIVFSSFYNNRSIENNIISFSDALLFINMFLVSGHIISKYHFSDFVIFLKRFFLIYILLADISTFLIPISNNSFYFIGTKFVVSYLHIFYLGLLSYNSSDRNSLFKLFIFLFYSLFIIGRIGCSTGIIGLLIMIFLVFLIKRRSYFFVPNKILFIILICFIVFINLNYLLSLPFIQNFIVNVLGEDLSLTGRMKIYDNLNYVISFKPLFGYGFENTAVANIVGYGGNTQNGIYEILVNYGFFGLIGFLFSVFFSCRKISFLNEELKFLSIILITLSIISIVEISFNYYFIFCLSIIFALKQVYLKKKGELV